MGLLNVDESSALVLSTPNRKEILKAGPPQQTKSNFLGKGSFGTVFKGIYQGKEVAVKVVRNDHQYNCLINEANVIGWRHKNIVKILQIESTLKFGIVIMERFPGHCLQKILDSNINIPLEHRVFITLDIVSALRFCHKQKVLHLDVKPQNILIVVKKLKSSAAKPNKSKSMLNQRSYICKLCDFGSSQKLETNKDQPQQNSASVKGTVRYMAPEALRQQLLCPATDIYSLGITMWQLKTRKIPYFWLTSNEVVAYLVVKNNIRPDSRTTASVAKTCQKSLRNIHETCYCTSLSDNHNTYQSVENIKYFLHSLNSSNSSSSSSSSCNVNTNESPARHPMKALVSRTLDLNIPHNLYDHKNINISTNINSCSSNSPTNLASHSASLLSKDDQHSVDFQNYDLFAYLFRSSCSYETRLNKTLYDGIYKSCWHKDVNLRPSHAELKKRLINLL